MTRWLGGLLAAFLAPAAPAAVQRAAPSQVDAAEIRRLESALAEALHARDRQRLESLLAAAYVLRGSPDVDRETWLRNAVMLCWGERSDLDRFDARSHSDVVVVSFELTFYVDPGTCRPGVLKSMITDVWVREPDGWKLTVRHAGSPPASAGDVAAQYGAVPEPPPVWEAAGDVSAVGTGGNTSTRTLGLGLQLVHRAERHKTDATTRFLSSQADDETNARSLTVSGRHGYSLSEPLQVFGEAAYARDRFAGIDDRRTVAAGVAYRVSPPGAHALTVEGGLGWTRERRVDETTLRFATATAGADYTWVIAPGTQLQEEASVHADLQSAGNWRASNALALRVRLTQILSLQASQAIEYRHRPVAGFKRSDVRTAVALMVSLTHGPG